MYKAVWMCMNWNKDLCFYLIWHFLFTQNFLGIQHSTALVGPALYNCTLYIFIEKKFTIEQKPPGRKRQDLRFIFSLPAPPTVVSTQRKLLTSRKMKEKLSSFTSWLLFIFPEPGSRELNIDNKFVTLNNFVHWTAPSSLDFQKGSNFREISIQK